MIIQEILILSEQKLQKYDNPFYKKNMAVILMNNFHQGHMLHELIFKKISRKFNFKKIKHQLQV